jgi:protein SCO1/2
MAQVSIVDKDGKLYQQVYGAVFESQLIVEPLKDLVFGRYSPVVSLQGIIDRIKLFCTVYDPNLGRYIFDYSLFVGIAIALLCLGLVLVFLVREWRRPPPGRTGHV